MTGLGLFHTGDEPFGVLTVAYITPVNVEVSFEDSVVSVVIFSTPAPATIQFQSNFNPCILRKYGKGPIQRIRDSVLRKLKRLSRSG